MVCLIQFQDAYAQKYTRIHVHIHIIITLASSPGSSQIRKPGNEAKHAITVLPVQLQDYYECIKNGCIVIKNYLFLNEMISAVRKEVNIVLVAIVSVIVVTFIAVPIVTYSCIKCFEWIDNR